MHYPPETSTVLLVLRIFAMIKTQPELLATFGDFCDSSVNEDLSICHKLLGERFTSQISELHQAFAHVFAEDEILSKYLTLEGLTKIFAMIGTNSQGNFVALNLLANHSHSLVFRQRNIVVCWLGEECRRASRIKWERTGWNRRSNRHVLHHTRSNRWTVLEQRRFRLVCYTIQNQPQLPSECRDSLSIFQQHSSSSRSSRHQSRWRNLHQLPRRVPNQPVTSLSPKVSARKLSVPMWMREVCWGNWSSRRHKWWGWWDGRRWLNAPIKFPQFCTTLHFNALLYLQSKNHLKVYLITRRLVLVKLLNFDFRIACCFGGWRWCL